jgi:proline racemase
MRRATWPRPASASSPRPTSSSVSRIPKPAAQLDHISFCQFAGPLTRTRNELQSPNAVVVRPGKIDGSRTGAGCGAGIATLSARPYDGGEVYRARSIIGSEFVCRIAGRPAIIPIVPGRAWITGVSRYMLDPDDPWSLGYRISDTWPRVKT